MIAVIVSANSVNGGVTKTATNVQDLTFGSRYSEVLSAEASPT